MSFCEQSIQLGALRVHFYIEGRHGRPVILLHGGGTDSALLSWRLAIPTLAGKHKVFAPDWPGYGQSDPLGSTYSNEKLVAILQQLMDAWQMERASLVGVSMGGCAALGFALAYPRRVDKLVLADSYGIQSQAPYHRLSYLYLRVPFLIHGSWAVLRRSRTLTRLALQSIFYDPKAVSAELVEEVYRAVRRSQAQVSFYSWQRDEVQWDGLKTNFRDRLEEITAPTLLIHGEQDRLVPVDCAYQAAQRIPGAQLKIIQACGHWPQREKATEFNQAVGDFLAG